MIIKNKEVLVLNVTDQLYYETSKYTTLCQGKYYDGCGTYYFKDGKFHRDDGPACVVDNFSKAWWFDGVFVHNTIGSECEFENICDLPNELKQSIIKYELSK
jgi:hypothetical protein